MGQESKNQFDKIVRLLKKEAEELEDRLERYRSDYSGILGAVKAVEEFRHIMRDIEALISKDTDYFNVVTRVWRRDGKELCDVTVRGRSIEFVAEDIDCSTSIGKVLETVLSKEENILYAFSKAFLALENFASEIDRVIDLRNKLENLEREINSIKEALKIIRKACSD